MLRGIAALFVVAAHSIDLSLSHGSWWITRAGHLENVGAVGVDLFFVISGFVMAYSVTRMTGLADASRFLRLRWARIAPPYWIACLLLMLEATTVPGWRSVANAVFFVPWADAQTYTMPPLDIGWTLSFEFSFYLLVAVLVAVGWARRPEVLGLGLLALTLIGLPLGAGAPLLLRWFTNPILVEFALGVGAYALWQRGLVEKQQRALRVLGLGGLAVLIAEVFTGYGDISKAPETISGHLSWSRVLLWGLPAAAVFLGAVALPQAGHGAAARALRFLGDMSYSLYLVHILAIRVVDRLLGHVDVDVAPPLVFVLALFAGLVAGAVFYRVIELPVTAGARRLVAPRRAPAERPAATEQPL